jgi:hypothetical protein
MAPFANLFNKHVGNLSERYKLTEATYDRFLDKFIEIKHRLKPPPVIRNESQSIEVMLVKQTELFTCQEQLQTELNEAEDELSKQSTMTTECQIEEKQDALESQGDQIAEIDTVKLAAKVINLRIRLGISMQSLAKIFSLSPDDLSGAVVHAPT